MKVFIAKILSVILIMMFFAVNCPLSFAAAKDTKNNSKVEKSTKKEVKRIRKYFGNKDSAGQDYSLESSAGVGGANRSGLNASGDPALDKEKADLYKSSPDASVNAIESVINQTRK
jgi:hypothetical protein